MHKCARPGRISSCYAASGQNLMTTTLPTPAARPTPYGRRPSLLNWANVALGVVLSLLAHLMFIAWLWQLRTEARTKPAATSALTVRLLHVFSAPQTPI